MSADLLAQLAQYGADHRARQAPVERLEILARVRALTEPEQDEPLDTEQPAAPRHLLVAAVAVVLVLFVGVAVVIVGRDASEPSDVPGTDLIRTTDPTVPSSSIAPSPTQSTTSTTAPTDSPEQSAPVLPSVEASASFVEPVGIAGPSVNSGVRSPALGAWDDGFLYVSVVGGLQMAAVLSDEMFARLPPEVQEAYPEQLQGTLGEVIARLQEHGWLDEVQAALAADPELEAAVLSGSTPPVELVAEFTVDGEVWTPVEIVAPAGMEVEDVFFAGDRLVVVGVEPETISPAPFRSMIVASTEDLVDWSVQTVHDAVELLDEVWVAANEFGWVVHIEPDLCERDPEGGGGCGWPPEPGHGYDVGEGPPLTWAAEWGAEPVAVDGAVANERVTVMALHSGFLAQHDELEFSADGVSWEPVLSAPHGVPLVAGVPLDDGKTAVFGFGSSCETEVFRVDGDGEHWERIVLDVDGAGPRLMPLGRTFFGVPGINLTSSTSNVLSSDEVRGVTAVFEQDGLRLTQTECWFEFHSAAHYELVDIESGDVVLTEAATGSSIESLSFDHLDDTGAAIAILDPASGAELVTFSKVDNVVDASEIGFGGPDDVWLLATANGTEWYSQNVSQVVGYRLDAPAVRNGDVVLLGSGEEWLRFELPGR